MITVEEAFAVAKEKHQLNGQRIVQLPKFADRELIKFDYMDALVEAGIRKVFNGHIFDIKIPSDFASMKIIEALKTKYEMGGWQVGLYSTVQGDTVTELQMVFAPGSKYQEEEEKKEGGNPKPIVRPLPSVAEILLPLKPPPRLLIRMPTRDRPVQVLTVIEKYRRMAGCPVTIEVICDEDDASMRTAQVLQRLAALGCVVTFGRHKSKVEACNGGRFQDWDILMLASDDMVPIADNYATWIIAAMQEHWPHLDGAIFFNDAHQKGQLCTLPIFGRRLYDQFGYVYDPAYQSLFCDREQTDILQKNGRLKYIDKTLIEHRHHIWGWAEKDALYQRNDVLESEDKKIYEKRKELKREHAQFAFDTPPLWLSLCICTLPARRQKLDWLLSYLYDQIQRDASREVEVLLDDRPIITIGEKRQALLERAKGHFVAFIDDDDGIAPDYLSRVVGALRANPDADCTSLEGVMTTDGARPEVFRHSVQFDGWFTKEGVHYRTPNHLNAIKRELALQVGFVAKNHGEDHEFSKNLRPLLKKEVSTGDDILYFYLVTSK